VAAVRAAGKALDAETAVARKAWKALRLILENINAPDDECAMGEKRRCARSHLPY
jgi:hypothetical protein